MLAGLIQTTRCRMWNLVYRVKAVVSGRGSEGIEFRIGFRVWASGVYWIRGSGSVRASKTPEILALSSPNKPHNRRQHLRKQGRLRYIVGLAILGPCRPDCLDIGEKRLVLPLPVVADNAVGVADLCLRVCNGLRVLNPERRFKVLRFWSLSEHQLRMLCQVLRPTKESQFKTEAASPAASGGKVFEV